MTRIELMCIVDTRVDGRTRLVTSKMHRRPSLMAMDTDDGLALRIWNSIAVTIVMTSRISFHELLRANLTSEEIANEQV